MILGRGEDRGISSFVRLILPADIFMSFLMQCIPDKGELFDWNSGKSMLSKLRRTRTETLKN